MKTKIAQKAIAAAMVVSMVATPLTAFATTQASSSGSSTAAVVAAATTTTTPAAATETPSGSGAPSTPATPATFTTPANGKFTAAGVTLNSTGAGVSTVKSLPGLAITAPAADLAAGLELGKGETAFSSSYDTNAKTAPACYAALTDAAASQNATLVGSFNMTIGKMSGYKFKAAPTTVRVRTTMIAPTNYRAGYKLSVAVVSPGGNVRIEQDQDTNPNTCTINANGGLGGYGLLATPEN